VQFQAGVATATQQPAPGVQLINVRTATVNLSDLTISLTVHNDGATNEAAVIDFATNSANTAIPRAT